MTDWAKELFIETWIMTIASLCLTLVALILYLFIFGFELETATPPALGVGIGLLLCSWVINPVLRWYER